MRILSTMHSQKTPLVVRASLPRTFWSLGLFVEASLLFCGLYLLGQGILLPLQADQGSILFAGVILALALTLLVYLVRPWRKNALSKQGDLGDTAVFEEKPLTAFGEAARIRQEALRILKEHEHLPGPM